MRTDAHTPSPLPEAPTDPPPSAAHPLPPPGPLRRYTHTSQPKRNFTSSLVLFEKKPILLSIGPTRHDWLLFGECRFKLYSKRCHDAQNCFLAAIESNQAELAAILGA
eukprot:4615122-Pleurochrysis_carterae.AAC.1